MEVDYLVARTPDELVSHVRLLKAQPELRRGLVEAGTKRAHGAFPRDDAPNGGVLYAKWNCRNDSLTGKSGAA